LHARNDGNDVEPRYTCKMAIEMDIEIVYVCFSFFLSLYMRPCGQSQIINEMKLNKSGKETKQYQ